LNVVHISHTSFVNDVQKWRITMPHVVETEKLLAEGVIHQRIADEIARRSRETMVALVVNAILCLGIIAATFGLVFWLADAMAVAIAGGIFLMVGFWVLMAGSDMYRMLGNAAALVGAGMLIGGGGIELAQSFRSIAEPAMLAGGAVIAVAAWAVFQRGAARLGFASGAIVLMGLALHLSGLALAMEGTLGWPKAVAHGYAAALIAAVGSIVDVRAVTALAILPFAQMLDTGTGYFHAAYVFYSPEATLTILQMAALIGACVWASTKLSDRTGRHLGILAIMGAVVGNLAFLVGSLWGDTVGGTLFQGPVREPEMTWEAYRALRDQFDAQFLKISEHVFTIAWALLLAIAGFWAAHANRRGLFNATMTFAGIHAYTQMFETFGDEPLAWALGGLAAIPLAWGLWRWNQHLTDKEASPA
jgi:hypothetical protein